MLSDVALAVVCRNLSDNVRRPAGWMCANLPTPYNAPYWCDTQKIGGCNSNRITAGFPQMHSSWPKHVELPITRRSDGFGAGCFARTYNRQNAHQTRIGPVGLPSLPQKPVAPEPIPEPDLHSAGKVHTLPSQCSM